MYRGLRVCVVVPAFNEEANLAAAVAAIPSFVDHVLIVDDASRDGTAAVAARIRRDGLSILSHSENRGVGAAIATGYRRALELDADATVVMAGDGQMDARDLPRLLDPIASAAADYVKGNRFLTREVWRVMPKGRIAGNVALSLVTKVTSGYWQVFDSQCGYTAASRRAISVVDGEGLFPRYGYPNDLLARLSTYQLRVEDVPVRPVYGPAWKSGIRLHTVVYPMSFVLARSWLRRLYRQYAGRTRQSADDTCASAS